MEGILVIDKPASCDRCKKFTVIKDYKRYCILAENWTDQVEKCPIRALPEKKRITLDRNFNTDLALGYNMALDDVKGEKK